MNLFTDAGSLASALALSAALAQDKITNKIPAFGAVHLTTADDGIAVRICNGDAELTFSIAANVEEAGELAVSAEKLAALTAAFPAEATIGLTNDKTAALIRSGRSHFRLPTLSIADLPSLALVNEIGRTVITHDDAVALFTRATFAIPLEQSRYYLNGLFLHDLDGDFAACATDGHRLARVVIDGAAGLSQDHKCIVPAPAMKAIGKLLTSHRSAGQITLRRAPALIEIDGGRFRLVSKLIDATFPDYRRAIGSGSSNNVVVVDRNELAGAFWRIAAVASGKTVVGLSWPEPDPEGGGDGLRLCAADHPETAHDFIVAKSMQGKGRIAFQASHGVDLLDALDGAAVTIEAAPNSPIWITDDGTGRFLVVQMPCAWRGGTT